MVTRITRARVASSAVTRPVTLTHGGGEATFRVTVIVAVSPLVTVIGCVSMSVEPKVIDLMPKPRGSPLDVTRYWPGGNWAVNVAAVVTLMDGVADVRSSTLVKLIWNRGSGAPASTRAFPRMAIRSEFCVDRGAGRKSAIASHSTLVIWLWTVVHKFYFRRDLYHPLLGGERARPGCCL